LRAKKKKKRKENTIRHYDESALSFYRDVVRNKKKKSIFYLSCLSSIPFVLLGAEL
jgi:hypothetical protein